MLASNNCTVYRFETESNLHLVPVRKIHKSYEIKKIKKLDADQENV
jgi:hypothetical protein